MVVVFVVLIHILFGVVSSIIYMHDFILKYEIENKDELCLYLDVEERYLFFLCLLGGIISFMFVVLHRLLPKVSEIIAFAIIEFEQNKRVKNKENRKK